MLADHEGIDMLVNNAGRSIRRSVKLSYDRFHDYERTMTSTTSARSAWSSRCSPT